MTHDVASSPPRTRSVPACPVCGGDGRVAFVLPDRMHGVPGDWSYRRCVACGTVYQDPCVIADDVPLLYRGDYYTRTGDTASHVDSTDAPEAPRAALPLSGPRERLRDEIRARVTGASTEGSLVGAFATRSRWFRERAFGDRVMDEMLPRAPTRGRALDVGCGAGRLLSALASVGWRVEGLEPDPVAAESARRRGAGPVTTGSVPDDLPDGPFDLIAMVHVFEHLADPVGALRTIAHRLGASGRLVLVYPNPESLLARRWDRDWYGWEAPRHLTLLPRRALVEAARRAGLRVAGVRTTARWATGLSAQSRALREGVESRRDGLPDRSPTRVDRILAWCERVAVASGAPLGEEIVATLERRERTP